MEEGEEFFAIALDPLADTIPGGKRWGVDHDELISGFGWYRFYVWTLGRVCSFGSQLLSFKTALLKNIQNK